MKVHLELHTLSGNKSLILTPKRYNDHSRHFYITGESPLTHDTLRGTKSLILTLKRYDDSPPVTFISLKSPLWLMTLDLSKLEN